MIDAWLWEVWNDLECVTLELDVQGFEMKV